MVQELLMWSLAAVLVAAGLVGTVLPVLPSVPLVFAGLFVAAWANDFQEVGAFVLIVLGILSIASLAIDFLASVLGVQRVGATRLAILGAMIGAIVGIFFGFLGLLFAPFVGAVAGELLSHGKLDQASRVGVATWIGLIFGTLAKIALVFTMLGIFALAYFI